MATHGNTWQHTATHNNTRQHTVTHRKTLAWGLRHKMMKHIMNTHYNTLQHSCNTLQHTAAHCNSLQQHTLRDVATLLQHNCHTLQHISLGTMTAGTATHLQNTAAHCKTTHDNSLQHHHNTTATHLLEDYDGRCCNAFATNCNTLQQSTLRHIATHCNITATHCNNATTPLFCPVPLSPQVLSSSYVLICLGPISAIAIGIFRVSYSVF